MKVILEDRKGNQSIMKAYETVQADQDWIAKKCERIEIENRELKSRVTKLENRMLERNLIFHGIKEDTWDIEDNTKERIWKAISHTVDDKDSRRHLKIARGIHINSTKRLGRYREGHSHPLSVSFERQSHVDTLFSNKKHLPKGIYIDREYTDDTERVRKLLRPILHLAKSLPQYKGKSKLEEDYLVVQGKKYTASTIHKLPEDTNGFAASSRTDDNTLAFFGELNPFSNFHMSPFEVDGKSYHSSEQFIQEAKALFFQDTTTAESIMSVVTPLECKQLS